jgi:hypothetical protein
MPKIPNSRRSPRHPIIVPVEIRSAGHSFPTQSETTDISEHGCYVKTLFPMPMGTQLGVRMSLNGTEVLAKATVKTSDLGLGNGIEFTDFIAGGRQQLRNYLNSLNQPEEEEEPKSTIIR